MDVKELLIGISNEATQCSVEAARARDVAVPGIVGPLATTEALASTTDALAGGDEATETPTTDAELTPEQHERVSLLQTVLVEKFSTNERKLTPEDFGVVTVGKGRTKKLLVALTTLDGLYQGSWDTIMNDDKPNASKYTIEVDGQQVDTRKAMTWKAYQALIDQVDTPLPDRQEARADDGEPWTGTWLTGEQPDDHLRAQFGFVNGGGPVRDLYIRDHSWINLRFRPVVVV